MSFSKVLAIPDTEKIFLAFLKPAHRIDGDVWAQHMVYTNCWWMVHSDGDVVEVTEGASKYTEHTSLSNLNGNPSGFYFDAPAEVLYVHTSGSDDPSGGSYIIQSYFWVKIANQQPVDDPIIYNDDYFLPFLKSSSLPSIVTSVNELFIGGAALNFGKISFINDGWWDLMLNDYIFERKEFYLQLGGKRHGLPSFGTLFTGITGDIDWSDDEVGIEIMDNRYAIFKNPLTTKFTLTAYPNMDTAWENKPIPTGYGAKENIQPVLIDRKNLIYKLCLRDLDSIDEVRAGGISLIEGTHYDTDLSNGQFTLNGPPWLAKLTTYYIVISTDALWANAANYVSIMCDNGAGYADGQTFEIDNGGVWTGVAKDLNFKVLSKEASVETADEELLISFISGSDSIALKDNIARFKIAQSFQFNAADQKITKIGLQLKKVGSPTGTLRVEIHSDQAGTRLGGWATIDIDSLSTGVFYWRFLEYTEYENVEEIEVDFTTEDSIARDILEHALESLMGIDMSLIDSDLMDALEAARTETLAVFLDEDLTGEGFINRLGITSAFHFVPLPNGTFGPIVFVAGEPSGTPHLYDEDYISFSQQRQAENTAVKVIIKYDKDPTNDEWKQVERISSTAGELYKAVEILEVETWLIEKTDAEALGDLYLGLIEEPLKKVFIALPIVGFTMYPGQKVKLWRTRADNAGGVFDGVLHRLIKLTKNLSNGTVNLECWKDTQSY